MARSDPNQSRDDARTLALLKQHGRTATAFQVLAPGIRHWFADKRRATDSETNREWNVNEASAHRDSATNNAVTAAANTAAARALTETTDRGMIGFADVGSAWVTAGEPVASRSETIPVAEEFVEFAHARGKRVAFFATEGALASSPRFRRVLIGEQPVWNPMEWESTLRATRSLREQVRRARAKGVVIRRVVGIEPETDRALQRLMTRWLATRSMPSMHFLVELEPFVHREDRQLFVAEREGAQHEGAERGSAERKGAERKGEIVAFLSLAPVSARNGWLFEHLMRDPSAPNGTAELLVDFAMRALGKEGVTWATLGLAPLAGEVSGWLRAARALAKPFFNFAGLAAFKRKLRPTSWEPIYLAFPRERSSVLAMRDGLRAFAGRSLIGFGIHTVLRGPPPLLRALELSLIPWTIALALWPAEPWFPSALVQHAWVAFDLLLIGALYHLRRRWNLNWAIGVATAVTLDTALTVLQAITWNVKRVRTPLELLMMLVACAGPALAAVVLWGAVKRRRVIG